MRNYNGPTLRCFNEFKLPYARTVKFGHDSLKYFGAKIWNIIPSYIKDIHNITDFNREIKKWKPVDCICRLCRPFIHDLGFI